MRCSEVSSLLFPPPPRRGSQSGPHFKPLGLENPVANTETFDDICAFALEIPSAAIASKIHLDLLMRSPKQQAPLLIRESPIFPHNWKLATGDCPGLALFVGIHDGKQWRGDQHAPEGKQHAKHDGSQDRRPNGHPRRALHDVGLQ